MPEQRNYRFSQTQELQVGTPSAIGQGAVAPTSPEAALNKGLLDVRADPNKAIDGLIEQQRQISSNKQKLISSIIMPMKGLSDKPVSGTISDAEKYVNDLLLEISRVSGISNDAAVSMLLETWSFWQKNGNTWDTFEEFIKVAASSFFNTQDVIEWSKKLFETMQDGAPVFTPEYIMSVALDAVKTKNFTKYQNLLISLPFYKSVWSKQPIDDKAFSKATGQIATVMQAIQYPTAEMEVAMRNMVARYKLIAAASTWYKGMLTYVVMRDTIALDDIARNMKNRTFSIDDFESLVRLQMQRYETEKIIRSGVTGGNVVIPQRPATRSSSKLFKTVLAGPAVPAASGTAGTGTSSTTTSTTGSGSTLETDAEQARKAAFELTRLTTIIDKQQEVIKNNIDKINGITEQKAKGLAGDNLGLFSSLVTSGNVVKKIDETLNAITKQLKDIKRVKDLTTAWLNKYQASTNAEIKAQGDTHSSNQIRFKALEQDLSETQQSLQIQRIVLPKEIEYFELKQDYDTNLAQLEAPISALMVNSLVTTRDSRTGKLTTVNTRVTRPVAIKSAWETGKKIVDLLMQISQSLQASANNSATGQSMFKNAINYYKAAILQEKENNNMLMKNLSNIGLGQVNYTPVAVGKK